MGDMMNMLIGSEIAGKATEEAFAQVDIAGYNYAQCRYEPDAKRYPNRIIVGSETFPKDLDENWELVEKHPYVIGVFPGRHGIISEKQESEKSCMRNSREWDFMRRIRIRRHIAET